MRSGSLLPTIPQPDLVHIVVVRDPTGKSDLVRHLGGPTITKAVGTCV